jgi:nitrite reductase (NO-forming)
MRSRLAVSISIGATVLAGLVVALLAVPAAPGKVAAARGTATMVVVTAGKPAEFAFTLSKRTVPVGTVLFEVTNKGKVPHTFKVCSGATTTSKANACEGKATRSLKPGQSQTLMVFFPKKGAYEFLCTVPGHAQLGMKGLIGVAAKVGPEATTTVATSTTTATRTTPPTTTATTTTASTTTVAQASCANPQTTTFSVSMFDFGFNGVPASAPCGTLVVTEVNNGQVDHNIDFSGQRGGLISPGESQTFTVNLTPGTYQYVCDVPGHAALGMHGQITITG